MVEYKQIKTIVPFCAD